MALGPSGFQEVGFLECSTKGLELNLVVPGWHNVDPIHFWTRGDWILSWTSYLAEGMGCMTWGILEGAGEVDRVTSDPEREGTLVTEGMKINSFKTL